MWYLEYKRCPPKPPKSLSRIRRWVLFAFLKPLAPRTAKTLRILQLPC